MTNEIIIEFVLSVPCRGFLTVLNESSTKMCEIRKLTLSFIYFYLSAQTTYIPLKNANFKWLRIVSILPKIIHFSVIVMSIYITYEINGQWVNSTDLTQFLKFSVLLSNIVSMTIAFCINLFCPFATVDILKLCASVMQCIEKQFFIKISLDQFQWNMHKNILVTLIGELFVLVCVCIEKRQIIGSFNLYMLFTYKTLIVLHVVVFIELMQFLLHSVNMKLASITRRNQHLIVPHLHQTKWIYYNLWKVSTMINAHFGWILTAVLLEASLYISMNIYYTFTRYIEVPLHSTNVLFILRNYKLLLFHAYNSNDNRIDRKDSIHNLLSASPQNVAYNGHIFFFRQSKFTYSPFDLCESDNSFH